MASMFFEAGSSSSSPSSSLPRWTYDVFLSFRGDTRRNFTDHLYSALVRAGIRTFRDNIALARGGDISTELVKAIQESRISIVVFSRGYASSTWCLEELANIMDCRNTRDQFVLPVFYGIDPSDVRKQKRSFDEAFKMHENFFKEEKEKEKVNRWRKALREASNLSGWDVNDMENGYESKFVENIVEDVWAKLGRKCLDVPKHLVGIDSHVENIIALIRIVTDEIRIVGIHGIGGIGKTTLAKAVFNRLYREFLGSSFLFNVKEYSEAYGLVQLQNQLLRDILKTNMCEVTKVDEGTILIKEKLSRRRVIVVLDDVDQVKQLNALLGERSCFGSGSVIILTSRNEHLLTRVGAHVKYEAKTLSTVESLQLFSCHAFGFIHPPEEYVQLSNDVLKYAGGLPLALEVLGSSLFKRSKHEWRSAIGKLQKVPVGQIQEKLRISFDTLNDDIIQDTFLDIACFFVGRNKEYVAKILDANYGFNPELNLGILIERSLLKISLQNELSMHDLVRDMGREIVRQLCPQHPESRSRIWLHEEALDVLNRQTGTKNMTGLALDVRASEAVALSTKSFSQMKYLKLLQINGVRLTRCYRHLPQELVWLCWHECPLKSLPPNFHLDNLAVLDMQYSNIIELKILNKLKILNLSYSKFAKTPNFLGLPSLERLIIEDCTSLAEVHKSVTLLKRLVHLSLKGCCRLKNLPESIHNLKSLETLDISMCWWLEKLPERLGEMESLTELLADETAIRQVPSSIGQLKSLRKLSLSGCNSQQNSPSRSWLSVFSARFSPTSSTSNVFLPASVSSLSLLTGLDLSNCGLSEGEISIDLGSLSSLQELNLSGNKFFNLPSGIGLLPKLNYLLVKDCTNLLSVPELPSSLLELDAVNCSALERLTIQSKTIPSLYVSGCKNLIEIERMEGMGNRWVIVSEDRNNLSNNLKQSLVQALCKGEEYDIIIADGEIPELFSHRGEGSSLSFHVPPGTHGNRLQALVVWVVCANDGSISAYLRGEAVVRNKSNGFQLFKRSIMLFTMNTNSSNQCSWVKHISLAALPPSAMKAGEELELSVEIKHTSFEVEKCGVHLIIKKPEVELLDDS